MESSGISKKEYLKKYLSGGDKKKKKKKSTQSLIIKSRIVDDDIDLKNMKPVNDDELEIYDIAEEAPQIVGIIDERPAEVRLMSEFRSTKKWKIVTDEYGIEDVKITAIDRRKSDDGSPKLEKEISIEIRKSKDRKKSDSEESPPRTTEVSRPDGDTINISSIIKQEVDSESSPRKNRKDNYDSQEFPSRSIKKEIDDSAVTKKKEISEAIFSKTSKNRNYDSDSPRSSGKSNKKSHDAAPKGTSKKIGDSDLSLRPRNRNKNDSDSSPHTRRKNDSDSSPPRKSTTKSKYNPNHHKLKPEIKSSGGPSPKVFNYDSDASPPRKSKRHYDSDASPPRKSKRHYDSDASPPRKSKRHYDSNASPPRKSKKDYDSDASPPRKSKRHYDSDASPPRKSKKDYDSEASPPRKSKEHHDSDPSPPRKKTRRGSGRKDRDLDSFPHRKSRHKNDSDSSPPRRRKDDSDFSPPRKGIVKRKSSPTHHHKRSEESRSRRSKSLSIGRSSNKKDEKYGLKLSSTKAAKKSPQPEKTLSGKKAGLQSAEEMRKESENLRQKEKETFEKMSDDVTGKNATAVVRNRRTGRRSDPKEEAKKKREKEEKEAEKIAQYAVWGKGVKQVQDREKKLQDDLYEMSKPLARYKDDKDLEEMLKNQEREGDPMLEYIRRKKKSETGPSVPQYQGNYPPNRYGIRPGHKWDGVDRSNGYEKKWFDEQNDRKAREEEAFKWSTIDM